MPPSSGSSSPASMRNTVLLPAPFGPTSPTFSPGLIWNDASTNRIWPPYCLLTELNAITARLYSMASVIPSAAMGSARAASPSTGRIVSINPATGVPLGDVPDMTAAEVRAAVGRARAAQAGWGAQSVEARCKQVAKFAEVLMGRADEVIELLTKEMGKTRQEALGTEVIVVADLVRYFCKHAPRQLA